MCLPQERRWLLSAALPVCCTLWVLHLTTECGWLTRGGPVPASSACCLWDDWDSLREVAFWADPVVHCSMFPLAFWRRGYIFYCPIQNDEGPGCCVFPGPVTLPTGSGSKRLWSRSSLLHWPCCVPFPLSVRRATATAVPVALTLDPWPLEVPSSLMALFDLSPLRWSLHPCDSSISRTNED